MTAIQIAESLSWGTYGKGAIEAYADHGTPLPPLRVTTLGDCSTNHLEAIILNLSSVFHGPETVMLYGLAIQTILEHRRSFFRRVGEMLCRKS